jgi:hypothetical protein
MYCPKCAAQNLDEAKFCRFCGSNLSLVPQAMTGRLPEPEEPDRYDWRRGRRRWRKPTIQGGIRQISIGLAFLIIAIALSLTKERNGMWMLIPAFILLGKGIGQIMSLKYGEGTARSQRQTEPQPFRQTSMREAPNTQELAPPTDSVRVPPPSVTEGTTRIFDPHRKEQS